MGQFLTPVLDNQFNGNYYDDLSFIVGVAPDGIVGTFDITPGSNAQRSPGCSECPTTSTSYGWVVGEHNIQFNRDCQNPAETSNYFMIRSTAHNEPVGFEPYGDFFGVTTTDPLR